MMASIHLPRPPRLAVQQHRCAGQPMSAACGWPVPARRYWRLPVLFPDPQSLEPAIHGRPGPERAFSARRLACWACCTCFSAGRGAEIGYLRPRGWCAAGNALACCSGHRHCRAALLPDAAERFGLLLVHDWATGLGSCRDRRRARLRSVTIDAQVTGLTSNARVRAQRSGRAYVCCS